jgi:hypothetical protein
MFRHFALADAVSRQPPLVRRPNPPGPKDATPFQEHRDVIIGVVIGIAARAGAEKYHAIERGALQLRQGFAVPFQDLVGGGGIDQGLHTYHGSAPKSVLSLRRRPGGGSCSARSSVNVSPLARLLDDRADDLKVHQTNPAAQLFFQPFPFVLPDSIA